MIQVLIKGSNFNGKFVALKDFKDPTVVGEGSNPQEALERAKERGVSNPVISFVPIRGMVQIF